MRRIKSLGYFFATLHLLHAHGLGKHRELGADVPIAHDGQFLAANLVALVRHLVPCTLVHLAVPIADLPRKSNDVG